MENFCGYKALDGSLHETEKSAKQADFRHRRRLIESRFDYFKSFIRDRVNEETSKYAYRNYSVSMVQDICTNVLLEFLSEYKLNIKNLWEEGEKMKEYLDKLKKEYESQINDRKPFWLRKKWW